VSDGARMRVPRLRLPRRLTLKVAAVISLAIALFCAFWSVCTISLSPPGFERRHLEIGAATTHVMFDSERSLIVDPRGMYLDFPTFVKRAALYGDVLASRPVRELIGERIGVPGEQIAAITRLTSGVERTMREPDSEQRANQLRVVKQPYRLELQSDSGAPVLHIYAQGPSAAAAADLANAAVASLREYLDAQADRSGTKASQRVVLTQLGGARGGVINSRNPLMIVLITLVVTFAISLAALMGAAHVRRAFVGARAAADQREPEPAAGVATPRPAGSGPRMRAPRSLLLSPRATMRTLVAGEGDWPRTTRVMPWLIAAFMVVLWLVPFNTIELSVSLPFDMKFDRLVLPIIFAVWVLALATGGSAAPRVRVTVIHVGIGAFIAVACLGIVLAARDLNQTLELELPVKKLSLLLSYGLLFVIVASSVRRAEVPAFLKFTLGLAVLCAIGVIWEYRFRYNAFYSISDMVLPGFFHVAPVDPNEVDDIGRRMTRGPAEHPLETVAMLSMALPIALVGIIHSADRRRQIMYGLAACLLIAAAISTYRKSALLAPAAVVLTIAYFRRRELLRLAPLGFISVVLIHALSPGALGSILFQLHPSRLGVSTVSDRAADYDAIRPDLWTHLAFGRGYGSYDHVSYRVLDSEILNRIVDTGALGLLTLVLLVLSIVIAASGPIRSRPSVWGSPALAVAAAAVAFLVLAFLFDVSSFPHTPYILMSLAGLLAVVIGPPDPEELEDRSTPSHRAALRRLPPQRRRPVADEPAKRPQPARR
jgi:hypothetical protein